MKLGNTKAKMEEIVNKKYCNSYGIYVYSKGDRGFVASENVDENTYFDVASTGKVMVTAPLILMAISENKLSLDNTLEEFFENVPEDKKGITVKHLLTHTSGIIRYYISRESYDEGGQAVVDSILSHPLLFPIGSDYTYSCNGFILLGYILEKIYGMRLDRIFEEKLKKPLGMTRACFAMPSSEQNRVISHGRESDGEYTVDDENVYSMRGIAGSGAQFYSMADATRLMDAIMQKSPLLYKRELFDLAEKDYTPNFSEGRGLGYWISDDRFFKDDPLFSSGISCHIGSTGTGIFFEREKDLYVIVFTNLRRGIQYGMGLDYTEYMNKFADLRREIFAEIKKDIEE